MNEEIFRKSVYTAEEIFHPSTLAILRNKSMFDFQEQYSSYYGLCFTMQNLKPQKVSDYSFQFVVNRSIDYTYYLHEPLENEWLFMSVYPYEIVVKYLDVHNDNEIFGISIIVQKQIVRKIPEKRMIILFCVMYSIVLYYPFLYLGGCGDTTLSDTINCWKDNLAKELTKANLTCKVPALSYTRMKLDHLNYCTTKDDALQVETIIYKTAIKNLKNKVCDKICSFTGYTNKINRNARNALSKEVKQYGDGDYTFIWLFYSSLYVPERVEHYTYDLTKVVAAIGGSLSMFLGWSIKSILLSGFEFANDKISERPNIKGTRNNYSAGSAPITKHTLCAILEERMDNKIEGGPNSPDSNNQSSGNVIVHRSHSPDLISNPE